MRVLCVEDSPADATLLQAHLEAALGKVHLQRVETPASFAKALLEPWDLVIADHNLPAFGAGEALLLLQETGRDIPFVVVSGTAGEEQAVEAMRAGAQDFVSKNNLARLVPVVTRELKDAAMRQGRMRAESMLREARSRLGTVLRSTQDRVLTFDRSLRVTAAYGAWLATPERSQAELVGRSWADLLGEGGRAHEAELRRALQGLDVVFEWSREEADGRRHHYQTSASPLRGEGGTVAEGVATTRDITHLKEVEAELVLSERMVAVGGLAASVAHEINNPLAAIVASLELAIEELPAVADAGVRGRMAEVIGDARAASERVRDIVRDLRLLARGDDGQAAVDLRAVLESAARLARNEIRHRARLLWEVGELPRVFGSETRLGQVFLNLLVNAAQATPEGDVEAHAIVVRAGVGSGGEARVEVQDGGCGMPPEVLARLFTPFFTTKPRGQGTGLGLSISRRIVAEHGGRLEVESQVGRGSLFRVLLPAHRTGAPSSSAAPPAPAPVAGRRARILVIDDDPGVVRAIRRALQPPHEVEAAEGPEAVALVAAGERFDLVLCDLMMPKMSGVEVHARLGAIAPALAARMHFITGGAFTPATEEFLRTVDSRRISKPFSPEELRRIVNQALEGE